YEGFRALFGVRSTAQLVHLLGFRFGVGALGLAALGVAGGGRTRVAWLFAFVWALFAVNLPFRFVYLLAPYAGVRFPFGWMALEGIFLGCLAAAGLGMAWRSDRRAVRGAALLLALLAGGQALRALWLAPTSVPEFHPGAPGFRAPDLQYADARLAVFRAHLR